MKSFSLPRTTQCTRCPWKKAIDPNTIPDGFQPEAWQYLADSTPAPGSASYPSTQVNMQCHDSPDTAPEFCVGWLANQLTSGNNIALRVRMMDCQNLHKLQTVGQQRQNFTEILTDALAMNPELETPEILIDCPHCNGEGLLYPNDRMMRQICPLCNGERKVVADAADARDDAAEASREAAQGK